MLVLYNRPHMYDLLLNKNSFHVSCDTPKNRLAWGQSAREQCFKVPIHVDFCVAAIKDMRYNIKIEILIEPWKIFGIIKCHRNKWREINENMQVSPITFFRWCKKSEQGTYINRLFNIKLHKS